MATLPPARNEISDNYPNPSNAVARTGFGKLWDALFGTDGPISGGGGTLTGPLTSTNGFKIPPLQFGLRGTGALALEGGVYRFRVFSGFDSLGVDVQQYAEHSPGSYVILNTLVSDKMFSMNGITGAGSSPGGWTSTSDQRVKHDRRVIENALDKVEQLTGYTYSRSDMETPEGGMLRRAGLIAQDVLKVLPETVTIPANYNLETGEGGLLGLSMDGCIGLLVNAVKELRAEVKALKAERP